MNEEQLISLARQAQKNAYTPYSAFKVGAALLTKEGQVFCGANVENASYGLTVCAERIAIFKAVSEGQRNFSAIAVVGSGTGFIRPCGACLQVMLEFNPTIKVIMTNELNDYQIVSLQDLLPYAFKILDN